MAILRTLKTPTRRWPSRSAPVICALVALSMSPLVVGVSGAQPLVASGMKDPVVVVPAVLDFGSVSQYSPSGSLEFAVTANTDVTISSLTGVDRVGGSCPTTPGFVLKTGFSCTVAVQVFALTAGTVNTQGQMSWNSASGTDGTVSVAVKAAVIPAPVPLHASPSSIDLGSQARYSYSGASTITFTATTPIVVGRLFTINGSNDEKYFIVSSTCWPSRVLPVGGTCTATVAFEPLEVGTFPGTVVLSWLPAGFPSRFSPLDFQVAVRGAGTDFGWQTPTTTLTFYSTTSQSKQPHVDSRSEVVFFATVAMAPGNNSAPFGTVSFFDRGINNQPPNVIGTRLGTVVLNRYIHDTTQGALFLKLSPGVHTITAEYSGDLSHRYSLSSRVSIVVAT